MAYTIGNTPVTQVKIGTTPISKIMIGTTKVWPVIQDHRVTKVSIGHHHSLFLRPDGTVWSCGMNVYGALGRYTTVYSSSTVPNLGPIPGLANVKDICAGGASSYFLLNNGDVLNCGYNLSGELGRFTSSSEGNAIGKIDHPYGPIVEITASAYEGMSAYFRTQSGQQTAGERKIVEIYRQLKGENKIFAAQFISRLKADWQSGKLTRQETVDKIVQMLTAIN